MEGGVEGQKMLLPVPVLGEVVHEEGVLVAAVFVDGFFVQMNPPSFGIIHNGRIYSVNFLSHTSEAAGGISVYGLVAFKSCFRGYFPVCVTA